MPYDFDDDQLSNTVPEEVPVQPKTEQVQGQVLPPKKRRQVQVQVSEDDELEIKMAKMQYYWDVVGNPIFPDTDDELAIEVENEIYAFVRGKLEELMGAKKRGRKSVAVPKQPPKRVQASTVRTRHTPRGVRQVGQQVAQRPISPVPQGANMTGEDIIQVIVDPNGFERQRIYRQMLDKATDRRYYLCYAKDSDGLEVGDGNKYELTTNSSGGQYFRVVSEQTLPQGSSSTQPMTLAAISQASEQHANATLAAIRRSNPLMSQALGLALNQPE